MPCKNKTIWGTRASGQRKRFAGDTVQRRKSHKGVGTRRYSREGYGRKKTR
jgi:hypothetical protein